MAKWDWRNSPIVVVPIALMGCCAILVPFRVWDTDHAAAFYGAFLAAFVAAGAVIGNSAYQARLADRRADVERQDKALYDALFLWSFLNRLEVQVAGLISVYQSAQFNVGAGGPRGDDGAKASAGVWRRGVIGPMRPNFETAMSRTALLPKPQVFPIIDCLNGSEHAFASAFAFAYLEDETYPTRDSIAVALTQASGVRSAIVAAKSVLNTYLTDVGSAH